MLMKEISQSIAVFASDAPTMDQLMSALRFEGMHHSEDQRWVALEFVAGLVSENATRAFFPDDLPIVTFDPEENLVGRRLVIYPSKTRFARSQIDRIDSEHAFVGIIQALLY